MAGKQKDQLNHAAPQTHKKNLLMRILEWMAKRNAMVASKHPLRRH